MTDSSNGIYYFLGNITSHVLHALPLYKELGGTFIVTSKRAQASLKEYGVPVVCVDNVPYVWKWQGRRPRRITEYLDIDHRFDKTVSLLNMHSTVVVFYELFNFADELDFEKPKKIFLTHGNMLKNYFKMHPQRLENIKQYDYMAALGPFMKREFIRSGIDKNKLIDIGVARTDDVLALARKVTITDKLTALGVPSDKPVVSYLPTFWGDSSVEKLGPKILENISDDYSIIFRPHPQTPQKILNKYSSLLTRKNVFYVPERGSDKPSLLDIYASSSVIIGDASSVMLEALLLDKPLVFAEPDSHANVDPHNQLIEVERFSQHISIEHVSDTTDIIEKAIAKGIDHNLWDQSKATSFFDAHGGSTQSIARFIQSLKKEH